VQTAIGQEPIGVSSAGSPVSILSEYRPLALYVTLAGMPVMVNVWLSFSPGAGKDGHGDPLLGGGDRPATAIQQRVLQAHRDRASDRRPSPTELLSDQVTDRISRSTSTHMACAALSVASVTGAPSGSCQPEEGAEVVPDLVDVRWRSPAWCLPSGRCRGSAKNPTRKGTTTNDQERSGLAPRGSR
jgi:hypothetical protein